MENDCLNWTSTESDAMDQVLMLYSYTQKELKVTCEKKTENDN